MIKNIQVHKKQIKYNDEDIKLEPKNDRMVDYVKKIHLSTDQDECYDVKCG